MINGIQYLPGTQIDKEKWNLCVANNKRSYIYAYTWYLDAAADNWDGLVWGDYEIILPVTWRKKWGIKYIYQPVYAQVLPIVGNISAQPGIVVAFMDTLIKKFRWIHTQTDIAFTLNEQAVINRRSNYYLPLTNIHGNAAYRHTKEFKKNLNKSTGLSLEKVNDVGTIISYYNSAYGKYLPDREKDIEKLQNLLKAAHQHEACDYYTVVNERNEILFAAALLKEKDRLIYIAAAPNQEGRNRSATHFFIDAIIQRYAGTGYIFDFGGSDVPNVASFFKKFSPEKEVIYEITINRLPFILKKIKALKEQLNSSS